MRIRYVSFVGIGLVLAGCASGEAAPTVVRELSVTAAGGSAEDAVREAALALSAALEAGDAESAWAYYSQRCRDMFGSVETYELMMEVNYEGRNPDVESVTVRVNGSSAQVVTVDNDPAAPADSMNPRTWTFIDDRWQFDNC
ncbi:hypothetical protein [Rhodococcus zopfii]|uniref:hypothetical protein n=1 Tax=Rhodococcus zopfii TaxID=43772 RepID=UPI0011110B6E|nr:hypothetical protein [Rhodococcus zopfii]